MMKIKLYLPILVLLAVACRNEKNAEPSDTDELTKNFDVAYYGETRDTTTVSNLKEQLDKNQQRLAQDSTLLTVLANQASTLEKLFDETGEIDYLGRSVRFRESAVEAAAINRESYLRALATAYIKQHRFKEADSIMDMALDISESVQNKMVAFDVAMELGEYDKAEQLLGEFKNLKEPNYLIRAAKWNDYKGNLSATIDLMEKNLERAKSRGDKPFLLWSQTNLADYYGHDGQLEESYNLNVSALNTDPTSDYAKKSIAWLAYAADDKPEKAMKIMDYLSERKMNPNYLLMKSELQEYMGNDEQAEQLKQRFIDEVTEPAYGDMYNAYLIEIYAEGSEQQKKKAVELAKQEVENRATPETYDLLAYAYYQSGEEEKALEVVKEHVEGKTFEPVAQLHMAEIYKANGKTEKAEALKEELMEARFELGPVAFQEVQSL